MGAQKSNLMEMVCRSTHDISFDVIFYYTHLDAFMVFLQAPISCECLFLGFYNIYLNNVICEQQKQ